MLCGKRPYSIADFNFAITMYSQEKSQVEICLLKSSLEEIENELIVQSSAWPKFDAENDRKFRESLNALRFSRALSVKMEKLNQENVSLAAKRMHLKMQSQELEKALDKARKDCCEMEAENNKEKQEIEQSIRGYEDVLREKSKRFRETRAFFNEGEMKIEIEKLNNAILELEGEVEKRRSLLEEKKKYLDSLKTDVPEDVLIIVGKNELDDKIKSLSDKCVALQEKRNDLVKYRDSASFLRHKN